MLESWEQTEATFPYQGVPRLVAHAVPSEDCIRICVNVALPDTEVTSRRRPQAAMNMCHNGRSHDVTELLPAHEHLRKADNHGANLIGFLVMTSQPLGDDGVHGCGLLNAIRVDKRGRPFDIDGLPMIKRWFYLDFLQCPNDLCGMLRRQPGAQ